MYLKLCGWHNSFDTKYWLPYLEPCVRCKENDITLFLVQDYELASMFNQSSQGVENHINSQQALGLSLLYMWQCRVVLKAAGRYVSECFIEAGTLKLYPYVLL